MSTNKYYRVPEKFQLKARSRRLLQQQRDGKITSEEYLTGLGIALADYDRRKDMPLFIDAVFNDVQEEEK